MGKIISSLKSDKKCVSAVFFNRGYSPYIHFFSFSAERAAVRTERDDARPRMNSVLLSFFVTSITDEATGTGRLRYSFGGQPK